MDFNTSHVTVYLLDFDLALVFPTFQYISCYCLSQGFSGCGWYSHISIHLMLLFIANVYQNVGATTYFNTSHVTVYHLYKFHIPPDHLNFNTSHVTVYLFNSLSFRVCSCISIHLMLLFIPIFTPHLSFISHFNTSHVTVYLDFTAGYLIGQYFNTSHVTVYRPKDCRIWHC